MEPSMPSSSPKALEKRKADSDRSLTHFDQLRAYESLVEAKRLIHIRWKRSNEAFGVAHAKKELAKDRVANSRVRKRKWKRIKKPQFGDARALVFETSEDLENAVYAYDEPDFDDDEELTGGTDWGLGNTGDHEHDRGEEIGEGDWEGMDNANHQAIRTFDQTHTWAISKDKPPETSIPVYDPRSHCIREGGYADDEYLNNAESEWHWEEVPISPVPSTPNSLFDEEGIEAKEEHKAAKAEYHTTHEETKALRSEECRYERMIKMLQKQYPELRMIVDFGDAHERERRRRERVVEDFAVEDGVGYEFHESGIPVNGGTTQEHVPPSKRGAVQEWLDLCKRVLKSHHTLTEFPTPPAWRCSRHEIDCHWTFEDFHHVPKNQNARLAHTSGRDADALPQRPLSTCQHNLQAIFSTVSAKRIREYLVLFHPDKFALCPVEEDTRTKWQAKAHEIFVLVSAIDKAGGTGIQKSFMEKETCTCKGTQRTCTCGWAHKERKYGGGWEGRVR
ncbi:hypothetical protein HII31_10801 [Pseudocercospora fuligena]|uniref:Uncharacterized protein n=1 Tax=Pseudocercospora fuligena TaxID=685502 RepID=A0A8H6RB63_9PEZI|nr:hypothetical protein HII31_10801 [Pseudocercospora fuligena]